MVRELPRTIMADNDSDALAPIDATPDGIPLAQWAAENSVGRTASFAFLRIIKTRGLEPERIRQAGVSKPSPFLSGRVLEVMNMLLQEFKAGRSIASLEAEHGTTADEPQSPKILAAAAAAAAPELLDEHLDVDRLFQRLRAAELAIATGLPLSKTEISWILGASPTTEYATTAPVRVEKRSARGWALLPPK